MKKLIIILLIILTLYCFYSVHRARQNTTQSNFTPLPIELHTAEQKQPQRKYLGTYTIYAYCPCAKCCGKENGITASGTIATEGRTVAANLPFGTKLYIEGVGERIVEDRGGGIGTGKIDIFMSDHNSALKFGVRKLDVYEVMK